LPSQGKHQPFFPHSGFTSPAVALPAAPMLHLDGGKTTELCLPKESQAESNQLVENFFCWYTKAQIIASLAELVGRRLEEGMIVSP